MREAGAAIAAGAARPARRVREARTLAPVLEAQPGSLPQRYAAWLGRHPVTTFASVLLGGFLLVAALSVLSGLVVTDVVLADGGIASLDERLPGWLAAHRTDGVLDASIVGSTMAGGVVLPILVGVVALACGAVRQWRIAAFAVFVLAFESGVYRATTTFVGRERPAVGRLEQLPADASYPSGHTAAAVAVYVGLAVLLSSRLRGSARVAQWARVALWAVALAIPPFVAFARIARGMHHPLDALAGVAVGIAALAVVVFAARAAGHAAERCGPSRAPREGR